MNEYQQDASHWYSFIYYHDARSPKHHIHSTQCTVKYSEIVLKFAKVVSANPVHSRGNNQYFLRGKVSFTLLVTLLLHYNYIFPEIKEFLLQLEF
jgi:hypothetical protein